MRILIFVILFASSLLHAADDPTAHHRKVYAEVDGNLKSYRVAKGQFALEGAPTEPRVTTWTENGVLRKMAVDYPDDHGRTVEEYYYDRSGLVFVFAVVVTESVDGTDKTKREGRYYFRHGAMIRWLDENKERVPAATATFLAKEAELLESSRLFSTKMAAVKAKPRTGEKASIHSSDGIFDGVEEGDYFHLLITENGKQRSFFVLQTDASLDRLMENPDKYIGKRVRVFWRNSVETIPEAGGKMAIETVVSVIFPK